MGFKNGNLYAVDGELFTWEGLDTFKINKSKIKYLYLEAPRLEISENLYLIKGKCVINGEITSEVEAELINYEGYGRYTSLGNIEADTLEKFIKL